MSKNKFHIQLPHIVLAKLMSRSVCQIFPKFTALTLERVSRHCMKALTPPYDTSAMDFFIEFVLRMISQLRYIHVCWTAISGRPSGSSVSPDIHFMFSNFGSIILISVSVFDELQKIAVRIRCLIQRGASSLHHTIPMIANQLNRMTPSARSWSC